MPRTCAVLGCSSRSSRDINKKFFTFPGIRDRRGNDLPEGAERRQLWVTALHRSDFPEEKIRNASICSDHFISGYPSEKRLNPDYVPTLNMGYGTAARPSYKGALKVNYDYKTYVESLIGEDEDPILRKRLMSYQRKQRWMAKQSPEELDRMRQERRDVNAEAYRRRIANETPEQRQARRDADAEAHRQRIANETPEQRQARRDAHAEYHRQRIANETAEERQARLDADAEAHRQRIVNETPEERQTRLDAEAEYHRQRIANETPEQKQVRRDADAEAHRQRIANETPEERRVRLDADAEYHRQRIAHETPEQSEKRRNTNASAYRKRIANETPEERRIRLNRNAKARRRRIANKTLEQNQITTPYENPGLNEETMPQYFPIKPIEFVSVETTCPENITSEISEDIKDISFFLKLYVKQETLCLTEHWGIFPGENNDMKHILFSQMTVKNNTPTMEKQIILYSNLEIKFFFGTNQITFLPTNVRSKEGLEISINYFSNINLAQINEDLINIRVDHAYIKNENYF